MTPTIPYGGFLVCQGDDAESQDLAARLSADRSAEVVAIDDAGLVLAAWPQFAGQGLWRQGRRALAYDTDLTNLAELCRLANIPRSAAGDIGQILWTLYETFDIDFIDRLRGAFAFALWDGARQRLLVVTDPYGIRPVVYSEQGRRFAAASRIRQLALGGIDREVDPEAIYHYLFFSAVCSPVSIYRGVRKLEPGMGLSISRGKVAPFEHYDIRYQTLSESEIHWKQAIPAAVEKAVANNVPDDAPEQIGCFLSGGTDSSTVAGYCARFSAQPVKTFSIGFDDPHYNELDYAFIAARHFGTEQHEYLVTPGDVLELIDYLPQIYDEPFGNASVIAAYHCARLAREHGIEMMLGGDGGDEIFGGNERYVTNLVFERYSQVPGLVRHWLLEPLLGALPGVGPLYKAKRYIRRANLLNPRRLYSYNLLAEINNREIFQDEFLRQIDTDCFFQRAQALYDRAAPAHDTDRLLYLDMKYTITDNDLRKVTQMVEAVGLQVRYPLLDRDLVDFAATIPPRLKVKPGQNRYIFKQAMRGFLPEEIIQKTKHGMGLPIAKWLKEDPGLKSLLERTLFSGEPQLHRFVKPGYLDSLRNSLRSEETPYYGDSLWVFLMLELWLEENSP